MKTQDDQPAVIIKDLYKSFHLPHEQHNGIKQAIINIFHGKRGYVTQKVLNDISFEIKKGEFFGIVGRNGSGKSTLLKLLAGIYTPDKGLIQVNGSLTPFIELGVGFNPELTGRENIFMNGALLGFDKKQMEKMYHDIVEFAELEEFMDQKLKNYSSGMQVRLAFSIAIRARSDVLILDEVLAVGDQAFQQKCYSYFESLKEQGQTVVLVTHDMSAVKRFCTRAVLIEKGNVKLIGTPERIASQYLLDNIDGVKGNQGESTKKSLSKEVVDLKLKAQTNKAYSQKDMLHVTVEYELTEDIEVNLGYSIKSGGFSIAEQNTKALELPSVGRKKHQVKCDIPLHSFNPGSYVIDVAIFAKEGFRLIGFNLEGVDIIIAGNDKFRGGPMRSEGEWSVQE